MTIEDNTHVTLHDEMKMRFLPQNLVEYIICIYSIVAACVMPFLGDMKLVVLLGALIPGIMGLISVTSYLLYRLIKGKDKRFFRYRWVAIPIVVMYFIAFYSAS